MNFASHSFTISAMADAVAYCRFRLCREFHSEIRLIQPGVPMAFDNIFIHKVIYLIPALLLIGMPCAMEVGRRTALTKDLSEGVGALDTAVYGLFGLLLAFTFSGAVQRFDQRRILMTQEANIIGTTYLRLDLLQPDTQRILRPLFREYLDERIEGFRAIGKPEAEDASNRRLHELQNKIWQETVAGTQKSGNPAITSLTISSLNEMIDITTSHYAATRTHPPAIIYGMLVILALSSSFLAGLSMPKNKTRQWSNIMTFTLVISAAIYVIIDIEYPRYGLVRVEAFDQLLIDLKQTM